MNKFYPNTAIEPDKLTDEHLHKIRELYDASGLTCDKDFLISDYEARGIVRELEDFGRSERRLHRIGEFKMHFEPSRANDGKKYLRIYVGIPTHWYKGKKRKELENNLEKFGLSMIEQFGKFYSLDEAKKMLDIK